MNSDHFDRAWLAFCLVSFLVTLGLWAENGLAPLCALSLLLFINAKFFDK